MKLLLHAGMPKTGSSALQTLLHENRGYLNQQRVLYPQGAINPKNHVILPAACAPKNAVPRYIQYRCDNEGLDINSEFEAWVDGIKSAKAENEYSFAVMSSELIFGGSESSLARISEVLYKLFDEIELVLYIRRPSAYYLSSLQQKLKASHALKQPKPVVYRKQIDSLRRHISDTVNIHVYDEAVRSYGGIGEHFYRQYVDSGGTVPTNDNNVNTSISGEAMSILHSFRLLIYPDQDDQFTPDSEDVFRRLKSIDRHTSGFKPPELHAGVRRCIDESSIDLLWLRDECGLIFDEVDYQVIPQANNLVANKVDDVCPVDIERRELLLMNLIRGPRK